ncbi:MAG: hypothetical protein LBN27_01685, partial [Prevotellaceae bacterium]|nr:hypothetical protein [Prevotellaceae bacterium]
MLVLSAKITILSKKTWVFGKITSCEIERDIEKITATCKLTLPKNTRWKGETSIPVRRGDKIKVELGFDGMLETVFEGYIKTISAKIPVEITCEDNMFLLKQTAAKKKTYSEGNLKTILTDQVQGKVKLQVYGKHNIGKFTEFYVSIQRKYINNKLKIMLRYLYSNNPQNKAVCFSRW